MVRGAGLDDAGRRYGLSGAVEVGWGNIVSYGFDDPAVVSPGHSSSGEYATPEESVCNL